MPRMYDILRGATEGDGSDKRKEKTSEESAKIEQPLAFPKKILKSEKKEEKKREDHSLISKKLIMAVKQHGVDSQPKALETYENAVQTIEKMLARIRADEDINQYTDKLYELLDNIFNQLVMGDNILNNIYDKRKEDYYLPRHIVNVLILSSIIGLNMGFNKSRLSHLGLSSIFYDTGMDFFREITKQPRALEESESQLVRSHILKSLEIAGKIKNINGAVKETIAMHHERMSGKGYPAGVQADGIGPYAKILGLVDTYEAITHPRPYREGMNTHRAVRFLVSSMKNEFDSDVMKVFINKMSVYPIGSIVTLNTGEVARVISVQSGSPLRPVVMILRGANGENVNDRIIIDLSKQDLPSIKDSVSL